MGIQYMEIAKKMYENVNVPFSLETFALDCSINFKCNFTN